MLIIIGLYLISCMFMYLQFYKMMLDDESFDIEAEEPVTGVENATLVFMALLYPVVCLFVVLISIGRIFTNH